MKRILVPTDFSKQSYKALDYAVMIAKKFRAEIYLLHVGNLHQPWPGAKNRSNYYDALWSIEAEFNHIEERHQRLNRVKVQSLFTEGAVVDSILDTSKTGNIDMIVMGATGNASLRNKLFGSITTSVIAASNIPVIIVPHQYKISEPKKILLATATATVEPDIITSLLDIARASKSDINVVTFNSYSESAEETMEDSFSLAKFTNTISALAPTIRFSSQHLMGYEIISSLNTFINEQHVDLVTVIHHKKNSSLFSNSTSRKMAIHTSIPLLVIPAQQRSKVHNETVKRCMAEAHR